LRVIERLMADMDRVTPTGDPAFLPSFKAQTPAYLV
jgi:hypothetical protein